MKVYVDVKHRFRNSRYTPQMIQSISLDGYLAQAKAYGRTVPTPGFGRSFPAVPLRRLPPKRKSGERTAFRGTSHPRPGSFTRSKSGQFIRKTVGLTSYRRRLGLLHLWQVTCRAGAADGGVDEGRRKPGRDGGRGQPFSCVGDCPVAGPVDSRQGPRASVAARGSLLWTGKGSFSLGFHEGK